MVDNRLHQDSPPSHHMYKTVVNMHHKSQGYALVIITNRMPGKIDHILDCKEEQMQTLTAINAHILALGRDVLSYCHDNLEALTRNLNVVLLLGESLATLSSTVVIKEDIDELHQCLTVVQEMLHTNPFAPSSSLSLHSLDLSFLQLLIEGQSQPPSLAEELAGQSRHLLLADKLKHSDGSVGLTLKSPVHWNNWEDFDADVHNQLSSTPKEAASGDKLKPSSSMGSEEASLGNTLEDMVSLVANKLESRDCSSSVADDNGKSCCKFSRCAAHIFHKD